MARIREKLDRAEWAKLSQEMQAAYVERNGEYVLDTEGANELRTAYDRTKQELAESKKRLADLGDVDAAEYQRLKEAEAKAIREREIEKGNFEKLVAQDREAHVKELAKREEMAARLRSQLEESLVDGQIISAIAKYPNAKVTPLLLGAKRTVKLQEIGGKLRAVVVDEKGEARLKAGAKTADDYMAPEDLIAEMRNNVEWAGNFPASAVASPNQRSIVSSSPQSKAQKEVIEQIAQQVRDGATRIG